jgi:hypothetical protein
MKGLYGLEVRKQHNSLVMTIRQIMHLPQIIDLSDVHISYSHISEVFGCQKPIVMIRIWS